MEVDYIRRKPLITVKVEVVVGGEEVPDPREQYVSVGLCFCIDVYVLPHASANVHFCCFYQSSHCYKKRTWVGTSGNIATVSRQPTVNTTRKPSSD